MKNVYFFSGLGADERVFQYVDLSFCHPVFIKWNLPFQDESIESYALRLSEQIRDPHPILAGVSFGGMMAIEIAKLIQTEKVILISSAKTRFELPPNFRGAGKINAHKIIPTTLLQKATAINHLLFSVTSEVEKALLDKIISDTHPEFLLWAIDKIVHWENEFIPEHFLHIHGAKDRILPCSYIQADYVIPEAGHFMIVQQAAAISKIMAHHL
ncbi:MAG: alpha/beta hydrolase [Chitinophagales bacterium]